MKDDKSISPWLMAFATNQPQMSHRQKQKHYAHLLLEVRKVIRAIKREPIARQLEMVFPSPKPDNQLWLTEKEDAAVAASPQDEASARASALHQQGGSSLEAD